MNNRPHGRGLPNLVVMLDRTTGSSGSSQSTTSTPSTMVRRSFSDSPGPSLLSGPTTPTPSDRGASITGALTLAGKRKRNGIEQKRDSNADVYYQSQKNIMEMRLAVEKEMTRREEVRLYLEKVEADWVKEREQREKERE
ncbi:uncharacterized protein UMAG_02746 [Mycosarcoma maydis]|uniref:Uncharacterized protein n=1 Tax=Mycosarcoma maydis TaxID=5270 RepID=A0A0D1E4R7_MYCMD|nr:uncharacterized protein UMAG_02746 [Ustilago maydis 521]KIS69415.1 hypothetical protein UMAG_02746 [Ustilago maydis 521]|eukprot:XP_011389108.1 hypothetical protein UMAG_02746 [Ustilago maydis 521]